MDSAIVKLYTNTEHEIERFINRFYIEDDKRNYYSKEFGEYNDTKLEWQKKYQNPIEIVDIIGTFIENNDQYKINMWISIDPNCYINVTDNNADKIIRYLYERYPW